MHDLACVAHVHSVHSDGTATVPEIAAAARDAGVDAVLVTDHDSLGARHAGEEGLHDGVLVVAGHEISPRGGHFLAFGLDREIDHRGRTEAEICAAVAAAGGFGFAAHPFSEGSRISTRIGRPHPWRALGPECGCGIELWSLVTDSAEACTGVAELMELLRRPEEVLDGPPERHLRAWDALCRRRRVPAIGGLDAHQTGVRIGGRALSPMPHRRWFRLLQTNLLLDRAPSGDVEADRALVHDALREGRCLLVRRDIADARGARLWADGPDGAQVAMGGETHAGDGRWTVRVRLPRAARVRLIRDGEPVVEEWTAALDHDAAGPGVYRAEARLPAHGRERTWLVTNPVYLRA